MKLTDDNAMFLLKEGENKEIKVHIWLEGTDPACTDELKATNILSGFGLWEKEREKNRFQIDNNK